MLEFCQKLLNITIMRTIKNWLLSGLLFMMVSTVFSQGKITGTITDGQNSLPGANVAIKGSKTATSTDFDGKFSINTSVTSGEVVISFIGYDAKTVKFSVSNGGTTDLGKIVLTNNSSELSEVVITSGVIDIAKDRKTPVAVSTIKAAEIQEKLGTQEFPEILKNTPSVYASKGGGGFGDSRIVIRGFDQKNVAVMVNGMPVNDMEGGTVYWSNWAGLSDVTSAMQVQRGLGASKLAIASVGGTINVVTKSSDMKQGGSFSSGFGNANYLKVQGSYSTGKMKNGLSASILLSSTSGDGYVDGTEFRGQNYFIAFGYTSPSSRHSLEFTFTGAAQWHNQRYGYITLAQSLKAGNGVDPNIKYNRDWGYLNGQEYNMNTNFYNKPVGSINYDFKINDNTKLSAIVYGSWGRGGGSGAWGKASGLNYDDNRWRTSSAGNATVDFDKLYAYNSGQTVSLPNAAFTSSANVTRAMVGGQYVNTAGSEATNGVSKISGINSHNWYGSIINFDKKVNDFTFDLGVDLRTYKGIHVRYLNDLLGGTTFKDVADINNPIVYTSQTSEAKPSLNPFYKAISGTPIIRNYTSNVNWIGVFGQAEYSKDNLTAYIQGAASQQGFKREDVFVYKNTDPLQTTGFKNIIGGNIKGGVNYNLSESSNVFVNSGYYSKQPFLTSVYPNNKNLVNTNLTNEKIFGLELGYGFKTATFNANVNVYSTSWKDRYQRNTDNAVDNVGGYYDFSGIHEVHQGAELELAYRPLPKLKINGMLSYGNWYYKGNSTSNRYNVNGDPFAGGTVTTLYLDKVKVGMAAQQTASLGASYEVLTRVTLDANYNYNAKLYGNILPANFSSPTNRGALELPSYNLFDAGFSYKIAIGENKGDSINFRLNVNNVFDTVYIAESNSNNFAADAPTVATYKGIVTTNQVYFGFGRTWNFSLRYNF